jgi:hypothetical protein
MTSTEFTIFLPRAKLVLETPWNGLSLLRDFGFALRRRVSPVVDLAAPNWHGKM